MQMRAYGLVIECDLPLPGVTSHADTVGASGAPLLVSGAVADQMEAAWSGPRDPPRRVDRLVDGRAFVIERGAAGDTRLSWGREGLFHLDVEGALLRCWGDSSDVRWQRVLFDSVLASVALVLGTEALHAGAVVVDRGAVAVLAHTGGGKSSLVAELVARGHPYLSDDVLAVSSSDGALIAYPAPPFMNIPRESSLAPQSVGTVLAELESEMWVGVRDAVVTPVPLRALVLLDRRLQASVSVELLAPNPLPLLPHLLQSGGTEDRRARRFALAGDLADGVPLVRLAAAPDVAPTQLVGALAQVPVLSIV